MILEASAFIIYSTHVSPRIRKQLTIPYRTLIPFHLNNLTRRPPLLRLVSYPPQHEGDFAGDNTNVLRATEDDISVVCGSCATVVPTPQPTAESGSTAEQTLVRSFVTFYLRTESLIYDVEYDSTGTPTAFYVQVDGLSLCSRRVVFSKRREIPRQGLWLML